MSYSRSYSATIHGTAHESVSYPASEKGGSMSVSVPWSEEVDIEILVDTTPFDRSVHTLKQHVDVLTGAVVATEAAQIEQKSHSASRISESVTHGFFQLIQSEITQQMAGLKSRVDSLLLKMNDMKVACLRVQQTMQQDYARIADRYSSIFETLDRETSKRVALLDEAAHSIRSQVSSQVDRCTDSTLSTVATITAAENSHTQSKLLASTIRQQMNLLLQNATAYLAHERQITRNLEAMLMPPASPDSPHQSLPVLYMETDSSAGSVKRIFCASSEKSPLQHKEDQLRERFLEKDLPWHPMSSGSRSQIERFFAPLVEGVRGGDQEHDARVREYILRLWRAHVPQTLPY
jgi:DNA-binding transcriptional regulator GbsR (MarR family)